MELISIRQVSLDYGISRQALYYYEEIGLIKSSRRNDYAYRLYDENAIMRLQQVIILRKLQISMKQIKDILNNPTAVAVIEIFKQNINELDERITALSTVKSILMRFIDELQEKADIRLKLDLLTDKSMLAAVSTFPFFENKINNVKEKLTMEELNKASETINKSAEKNVKIIYRLPATMAEFRGKANSHVKGQARKEAEAMAKKFIEDTDLYKLKPDMRVFGFYVGDWDHDDYVIWVTIPDNFEIPAGIRKHDYPGGLYATWTNLDIEIWKWVENSDEYEWYGDKRAFGEEYFNPFNIYGLKHFDSETAGYTQWQYPIREK